jgi:hypothetical protein
VFQGVKLVDRDKARRHPQVQLVYGTDKDAQVVRQVRIVAQELADRQDVSRADDDGRFSAKNAGVQHGLGESFLQLSSAHFAFDHLVSLSKR